MRSHRSIYEITISVNLRYPDSNHSRYIKTHTFQDIHEKQAMQVLPQVSSSDLSSLRNRSHQMKTGSENQPFLRVLCHVDMKDGFRIHWHPYSILQYQIPRYILVLHLRVDTVHTQISWKLHSAYTCVVTWNRVIIWTSCSLTMKMFTIIFQTQ